MEKIGFKISCEIAQLMLTLDLSKLFEIIHANNCDYIT